MNKQAVPIIGIDVGFGQTKARHIDGRELNIPSWTARINDNAMAMDKRAIVRDKSQMWLVGEEAHQLARATLPTVDSTYYETDEYRVLFQYAMSYMGVRRARVVTGLPVRYLKTHQARLIQTIQSWSDQHLEVEVLRVIAQPVGSMFSLVTDNAGNPVAAYDGKRVGIIDIGGGTIDAIEVNNNIPSWTVHASEPRGVNRIFEDLLAYVRMKGGNARIADMRKAIMDEAFRVGTEAINLQKPATEAKRRLVHDVSSIVKDLWGAATALDLLVITGGGAALVRQELMEEFKKAALMIPEKPDMANVTGYARIGYALSQIKS